MSHWAPPHTSSPVCRHCFRYWDTQHKMDRSIIRVVGCGLDGTEARHLVLTRDTNACSSGDVSQVTWPAEPSSDFHGPIDQESVAS